MAGAERRWAARAASRKAAPVRPGPMAVVNATMRVAKRSAAIVKEGQKRSSFRTQRLSACHLGLPERASLGDRWRGAGLSDALLLRPISGRSLSQRRWWCGGAHTGGGNGGHGHGEAVNDAFVSDETAASAGRAPEAPEGGVHVLEERHCCPLGTAMVTQSGADPVSVHADASRRGDSPASGTAFGSGFVEVGGLSQLFWREQRRRSRHGVRVVRPHRGESAVVRLALAPTLTGPRDSACAASPDVARRS